MEHVRVAPHEEVFLLVQLPVVREDLAVFRDDVIGLSLHLKMLTVHVVAMVTLTGSG